MECPKHFVKCQCKYIYIIYVCNNDGSMIATVGSVSLGVMYLVSMATALMGSALPRKIYM